MNIRTLNYLIAAVVVLCSLQVCLLTLSLRAYMAHDSSYVMAAAMSNVLLCIVVLLLWLWLRLLRNK